MGRIRYCCGGKKTLAEVCREKGYDPQELLASLEKARIASEGEAVG